MLLRYLPLKSANQRALSLLERVEHDSPECALRLVVQNYLENNNKHCSEIQIQRLKRKSKQFYNILIV